MKNKKENVANFILQIVYYKHNNGSKTPKY